MRGNEEHHWEPTLKPSPSQHGVEEDPQTPDINGGIVSLLLEHLGGHKVSRVAWRHQEPVLSSQLLGKAKVCNAQCLVVAMRFAVEDVGGFQVSMHHPLQVQVLDRGGLNKSKS